MTDESKRVLKSKTLKDIRDDIDSGKLIPEPAEVAECLELLEDYDALMAMVAEVPQEEESTLTVEQAAMMLGVSKQTIRNWEKEGRLQSSRTSGGHRRFLKSQVDDMRKLQMNEHELLLPDILPTKILAMFERLLSNFNPSELVNLTIKSDQLNRKVRFTIDSVDGLTTVTKTFDMED